MSWDLIATGQVNDQELTLYRSGPDYMIRVNGLELMNSRWNRSEKALAQAAGWCTPTLFPKILIGGLGLGFTLSSFLDEFGDRAKLSVVEQSNDVLNWYRKWFKSLSLGERNDTWVEFLNEAVQDTLSSTTKFDLIVLDVDNGPEALCGQVNNQLYQTEGLVRCRESLQDGGALLVWSAFESKEFEEIARACDFLVYRLPVKVGHREHSHFIYVCLKDKLGGLNNHDFIQAACYDGYASDYHDDIEFTRDWLGDAQRILEIGIGTGRLALRFYQQREVYFGIDSSAPMLHQLLKKSDPNSIQVVQANMSDFSLGLQFDRILFPFRVLPYAQSDENVKKILISAKTHLHQNGRILINMLDFDPAFVSRWNNQTVSSNFTGPDGEIWKKSDQMIFTQNLMSRKIQFHSGRELRCEVNDDLMWMNSKRLSQLIEETGLRVTNIWPAYQKAPYHGQGEYVLEASV